MATVVACRREQCVGGLRRRCGRGGRCKMNANHLCIARAERVTIATRAPEKGHKFTCVRGAHSLGTRWRPNAHLWHNAPCC